VIVLEVVIRALTCWQSVSWYIGPAQAGALLMTIVIYIMVLIRRRSKRCLKHQLRASGNEPTGG
jgi:hypothetical protein